MTYNVTVEGQEITVSLAQSGPQGAAGADGANLTFQGAWLTSTAFTVDDLVSNNGSTYACILNHTSSATDEPGVGANTDTYWTLFVEKGDTGPTGPTGPQGDTGAQGPTGPAGADGLGWTGGSYDAGTGVVTFTSDDGLGFVTGDLRGADGIGAGTVTSIDVAGGTGIDSTGGPITASGTITVALDAATVASLGLADTALQSADIGVTVQGYSAVLAATTASFTTADETKLDGIEALADVTDTANVTAAGALMDSEVVNLAAVKAFDPADYATAAQGDLADTALQAVIGTLDEIVVTGGDTISLATAVTTSLGLADSAVQPGDLATVATTGAYSDLSGTPTLGTMAAEAAADYLAVAGDAMTGDLTVLGVIETEDSSSATTYAMDPTTNGTRATLTLTAATTLTDSLSDGEHISLRILDGDTHAVTWVAGTLWVGGSAPTLTGDDRVTFEKWGTDLIGYTGLGIA